MNEPSPRIVFMGSPEFSLPSLRRLVEHYPVVGVVTQPDRPSGRGQVLTAPPVKILADELQIPSMQPNRLRAPEAMVQLEEWQPDLIVVTAFGQILRQNVLDLPRYGCVNVHASLLPRWRGAAPIQAALLHGDLQTGATIMRMDPGVDTGPILAQQAVQIEDTDTADTLATRLSELGADLLIQTLPGYLAGRIVPQTQDESKATVAPMLKKEDGLLDFQKSAQALWQQVRAFHPWPGSYFEWNGLTVKVLKASFDLNCSERAGSTLVRNGLPAVACQQGCLLLDEVQPSGKKPMPGKVFLNGARGWGGSMVEGGPQT